MRYVLAALPLSLFVGCAADSGVLPTADGFTIIKQAATGFPGIGEIKTQAMQEAVAYCQARGKQFQLTAEDDTQPPYMYGNFPKVELQFSCI